MDENELHDLLGRTVDTLEPTRDLVPGAVRTGRAQRHRRRVAATGGALSVLAVSGTLAAHGWPTSAPTGASPGASVGGDVCDTARTAEASASAAANPGRSPGSGPTQSASIAAYRARLAARLTTLLGSGEVCAAASSVNAYLWVTPAHTFAVTVRVDPPLLPGGAGASCSEPGKGTLSCLDGRLADGTRVRASHDVDGDQGFHLTAGDPSASYVTHDARVFVGLFGDDATGTAVPLTDRAVLAVATDPSLTALLAEWASTPELLTANGSSTTSAVAVPSSSPTQALAATG